MKLTFQMASLLFMLLVLVGCGDSPVFDQSAAQAVIESTKLPLSSEQEILCGEKKGLWTVDQLEGGGALGRLSEAGRALGFGDDVRMGDRKFASPYVQLQGNFNVKVQKFLQMTDQGVDVKIVEAKVGVIVKHECFPKALALLGIDHGDFSEDTAPRIHLRQHNGWTADQVLH
jgi:hypothetical protein